MKLYQAFKKLKSQSLSIVEYFTDSCVVMGLSMTPAQIAKQYMRGGDLPPALTPLPNEDQFVDRDAPRDLGEAMQEAKDFVNSVSLVQQSSPDQIVQNNPVSDSNQASSSSDSSITV